MNGCGNDYGLFIGNGYGCGLFTCFGSPDGSGAGDGFGDGTGYYYGHYRQCPSTADCCDLILRRP